MVHGLTWPALLLVSMFECARFAAGGTVAVMHRTSLPLVRGSNSKDGRDAPNVPFAGAFGVDWEGASRG